MIDENLREYILLKDKDDVLTWVPLDGMSVEEAKENFRMINEGMKNYESGLIDSEEFRITREVVMAIACLGQFFAWPHDQITGLIDLYLIKHSSILYKAASKDEKSVEEIMDTMPDGLTPYMSAIAYYMSRMGAILKAVDETASASADQKEIDEESKSVIDDMVKHSSEVTVTPKEKTDEKDD